ncbi:MAG: hypothetical protein QOE33_3261 [Acidobacteriota bacterium]|nr:hypothetical protein [Acidobacteriota bacterium]
MKCEACGANTFIQSGQEYKYTESGLDNVYLKNIELRVCESCEESSPRIPRILDVHSSIARAIALQPCPLRGSDIRFLRKQLGMRAREWAALMPVDAATFSRWEKGDQKPGPQSDTLLRFLYFRISEERESRFLPDSLVERISAVQNYSVKNLQLVIDVVTLRFNWRVGTEVLGADFVTQSTVIPLTFLQGSPPPLMQGQGFVVAAAAAVGKAAAARRYRVHEKCDVENVA